MDVEDAKVEVVDEGGGLHPDELTNKTPETLLTVVQASLVFVQTYGWFLLIGRLTKVIPEITVN